MSPWYSPRLRMYAWGPPAPMNGSHRTAIVVAPTAPAPTRPRHPSRARNHAANGTRKGSACGFVIKATARAAAAQRLWPRTARTNATAPPRT